MAATHEYRTRTVKGSALDHTHVLVGEAGGLCAVYEAKASSAMAGLVCVATEHGALYLDPDQDYAVADEGPEATEGGR